MDTATQRHSSTSRRTRIGVLLFILSPLAVVTVLCVLLAQALRHGQEMTAKPVGAGAGHTGMSNEYMGVGKKSETK
jgi:hypothetical protein